MNLAEAQVAARETLLKARAIEDKNPDKPVTEWSNEDHTEYKRLLGECDELESKIASIEETERLKDRSQKGWERLRAPAETHHAPNGEPTFKGLQTPGMQFIGSDEYQRRLKGGAFDSPNYINEFGVAVSADAPLLTLAEMSRKALVYSATGSGGAMIVSDRQAGLVDLAPTRERTLLDIVARTTTTSDTIEYVKLVTFTNNAAPVAEASVTTGTTGTKPESVVATQKTTTPVVTIAHWIPVTNKMLADAPAIRGVIDQHLLVGLELALEDEIITGAGTGDHLQGILNAGIQTYGAGSSNNTLDAVLHARTLVRVNGKTRPNAVVMHPNDWEQVRLARENAATGTLGGYLMGPPSQGGDITLWGMPVIEAEGLTENTILVGDFRVGGMLFEREGAQIRTGTINDYFVRNMQVVLAELRAAWATFRPNAFCRVTGA